MQPILLYPITQITVIIMAHTTAAALTVYLAYCAIGLLPVFTQQPCRSEIEQDTENEQYAYADQS